MRAPNCLWPREKNGSDGLGVRLGRVLHWVCATIAFLLIALGLVLAAVAILSGPANAQADARAKQTNETYPGWKELPKNAVLDDNSETSVPVQNAESATRRTSVLGAYSQRDSGSDMPLPNLEALPERAATDWELLRTAGILILGGIAVLLTGRGIRYILSNE